jgi:hypothetical protein
MAPPNKRKLHMAKCDQIRAKNKEEQMARAIVQLRVAELSSELTSKLEIPCEQDEEVAEATVPPSEAHWDGILDSDHEEESDIEYSNKEIYLSEDDLELDDAVVTVSQAPTPNAFKVMMMGKAYEESDMFNKASFRYQRGPELSNKQKKAEGRASWFLQVVCTRTL